MTWATKITSEYFYPDYFDNKTSDEASYQNLPFIYNIDNDCLPQENHDNLTTCSSKAWLVLDGVNLLNPIAKFNNKDDIHECLKLCLDSPNCVAIHRPQLLIEGDLRFRLDYWLCGNSCMLFDNSYSSLNDIGTPMNRSYLLKCCELKNKEISNLDKPNYPILYNMGDLYRTNVKILPVAYTEVKPTCNYYYWHVIDKAYFKKSHRYKNITLINTIDCLNECLKDKICTAFSNVYGEFESICYFYTGFPDRVRYDPYFYTSGYRLMCGKESIKEIYEKQLNDTNDIVDIMKVYEPTKFCKTTSSNLSQCYRNRIWHIEDGVRMKGHYNVTTLYTVQCSCLRDCEESNECHGVSVDYIGLRCLFFKEKGFTKHYRQFHWSSYTLKCCHGFLTGSVITQPPVTESPIDTSKLPNYPFITNIDKECHAQENQNIKTCAAKAWLTVDNLQIKLNLDKTKTNILSCFQQCLNSNECKGVTIQKSTKEYCWSEDGQLVNETNNEYKSFFLTCCELKTNPIINFPIVFNPQSNCKYTNIYALTCKNPAWHIQESTSWAISSSILNLTNTNSMNMLNECANNPFCKAVSMEEMSPFVTVFRQFQFQNNEEKFKINDTKMVFEKICCKFPSAREWISNNSDLVLLTQPLSYCKNISSVGTDCAVKIWFMQDGARLKGDNQTIPFVSVQNCLRQCLQSLSCKGISFDYYKRTCILFHGNEFIEYVNQPQWVSYLMKCCHKVEM